jgi:tetratricopeptide (TPR) repeat protein
MRSEYREAAQAAKQGLVSLHNPPESQELAGDAELWAGRLDRAKWHYLRALVPGYGQVALNFRHNPKTAIGYIEWKTGNKVRAKRYLREALSQNWYAIKKGNENPALLYDNAAAYSILGNQGEANRWLRKAVTGGWRNRRCILKDPLLQEVRMSSC